MRRSCCRVTNNCMQRRRDANYPLQTLHGQGIEDGHTGHQQLQSSQYLGTLRLMHTACKASRHQNKNVPTICPPCTQIYPHDKFDNAVSAGACNAVRWNVNQFKKIVVAFMSQSSEDWVWAPLIFNFNPKSSSWYTLRVES